MWSHSALSSINAHFLAVQLSSAARFLWYDLYDMLLLSHFGLTQQGFEDSMLVCYNDTIKTRIFNFHYLFWCYTSSNVLLFHTLCIRWVEEEVLVVCVCVGVGVLSIISIGLGPLTYSFYSWFSSLYSKSLVIYILPLGYAIKISCSSNIPYT